MAANLARVEKAVTAAVNASDSYNGIPDAGSRLFLAQIDDLAITIDLQLIEDGLKNPTWANRVDFQQSTSVAHGANLPAHTGPIDAVIIGGKLATPAPLDQIENERDLLAQGVTSLTPHYNADGFVLAHNGSSNATVKSCTVTRGVVLQGPDYTEGAIIRGVLSLIASPEGEDPATQSEYARQYALDRQAMTAGQIPPPFQASEQ